MREWVEDLLAAVALLVIFFVFTIFCVGVL